MDTVFNKKNHNNFSSPDINQLQEVVIDFRTKIYIAKNEDPEEAKKRYLLRHRNKVA